MGKIFIGVLVILCGYLSNTYAMPKTELNEGLKNGDPAALVEMGEIYTQAKWTYQSFNSAFSDILQKDKTSNLSEITGILLNTQRLGNKGLECIFQAAIKGNLQAQYDMIFAYKTGSGVDMNLPLAAAMGKNLLPRLQKSADDGDLNSEGILGIMYLEGTGVEKNEKKGIAIIEKSANNGNMESKARLAYYYFENGDTQRGLTMLKEAAERGNRGAQHSLGIAYNCGQYGLKKDKESAKKWLQAAANQGNISSEISLTFLK